MNIQENKILLSYQPPCLGKMCYFIAYAVSATNTSNIKDVDGKFYLLQLRSGRNRIVGTRKKYMQFSGL